MATGKESSLRAMKLLDSARPEVVTVENSNSRKCNPSHHSLDIVSQSANSD